MNYFLYNTDGQGRFSLLIKKGIAVTGGPEKYGDQLGQLDIGDMLLMYENGIGIVAIGKVQKRWDGNFHKSPVYYIPDESFFEGDKEYRIKVDWFLDLSESPISIQEIKEYIGYIPRGAVKKIIKYRAETKRMVDEYSHHDFFPEELPNDQKGIPEGAVKKVLVNAYERSREARRKCISHWGYKCQICSVSLEDIYGPYGIDFIHVHHLIPLSEIKNSYVVDPVNDMIPVCPNCHAILHRMQSENPIKDIKRVLKKTANKQIQPTASGRG
jgi:hypothetical protein